MKTIINILILAISLISFTIYGQQDAHYTQYMYNQNILNPAYAGSRGDLSIGLLGRMQWLGIDGAPDTQTLNISSDLGHNLGAGLSVLHDKIGPVEETNVSADISYTIRTSYVGKLAFGLKGSYSFLNIGLASTEYQDSGDVAFDTDYTGSYPNVGVGAYYYTDRFYAGIAIPALLERYKYELNGFEFSDVSDKMHYFGTLGYVFDLNDNLKLKPSAMVKIVEGSPISLDFNASLFINEKFELGLSYRDGDSLDLILGVQATPNIRVGYAYDYTTTNLGNYNSGSHELMLQFDLDFNKVKKEFIKSPRFF
jgi:type IX secretion system PorP/SprF family membrane protein